MWNSIEGLEAWAAQAFSSYCLTGEAGTPGYLGLAATDVQAGITRRVSRDNMQTLPPFTACSELVSDRKHCTGTRFTPPPHRPASCHVSLKATSRSRGLNAFSVMTSSLGERVLKISFVRGEKRFNSKNCLVATCFTPCASSWLFSACCGRARTPALHNLMYMEGDCAGFQGRRQAGQSCLALSFCRGDGGRL